MIRLETKLSVASKASQTAFSALLSRPEIGFFKVLERKHLWSSSLERSQQIRQTADQFVFVGIGGSSLGAKALLEACPQKADEFLFLENVDEWSFEQVLKKIRDFKKLHVVFVSKSGSTLETLALLEFLNLQFKARGLKLIEQATVISETVQNPLTRWAHQHHIPSLEIPQDVGGRFSVLSPVGFLPAALALKSLDGIQQGAAWAMEQQELIGQVTDAALQSFAREEWLTVFWHYGDPLHQVGFWWQQLWAESLAKARTRTDETAPRVSTPLVAQGAQDQHSLLQQFVEGARDKWFWFHYIKKAANTEPLSATQVESPWPLVGQTLQDVMNAERQGIVEVFEQSEISRLQWAWSEFSPKSVSGYFMLMQLIVGTLGEILQIDAFNQPGVEVGKRRARDILAKKVAVPKSGF